MRKIIIFAFLSLVFSFSFVFADLNVSGSIPNPLGGTNSLPAFFDGIVGIFIEIGAIVGVLAIMFGGFQYVLANGDPEKLNKARQTITWALVGVAVLLGARTIMLVVKDTVGNLAK